eukprot:5360337-Amphidinium_carterae.1
MMRRQTTTQVAFGIPIRTLRVDSLAAFGEPLSFKWHKDLAQPWFGRRFAVSSTYWVFTPELRSLTWRVVEGALLAKTLQRECESRGDATLGPSLCNRFEVIKQLLVWSILVVRLDGRNASPVLLYTFVEEAAYTG